MSDTGTPDGRSTLASAEDRGVASARERYTQMSGSTAADEGNSQRSAFAFGRQSENEGIPDLLRTLVEQGSQLAQQQTALIEAEVRASVDHLKEAAGAMAGAALVGISALGVFLMGLSYLLAEALPLWAATLIVAIASFGVAYVLFLTGKKKLQSGSFGAERTRRTLERAPRALSGDTADGGIR